MRNVHVLITAGPTHEPLDPVRFLGNRSSGKQGFAIAAAFERAGARVTLISGPTHLPDPVGVQVVRVTTAREMLAACKAALPADVFVAAAAVADWRPRMLAKGKLKKSGALPPTIELVENPDILRTIASTKPRPRVVVGFAAETSNLLANAEKKRRAKGCDLVLANLVAGGAVFDKEDTHILCLAANTREEWRGNKQDIAARLVEKVRKLW